MTRRSPAIGALILILGLVIAAPGAAVAQDARAFVATLGNQAIQVLGRNVSPAQRVARFRELFREDFDIPGIGQFVLGRYWRTATPEQQKRLTEEFQTLLIRTYSNALTNYRDNTINYKPLRLNPGEAEAVVRTEVTRPGPAPVPIDYSMEKTPDGWKAYDIVVAGVSLVTNYRDEFNDIVRSSGIDGLIKTLADKNSKGAPAK